MPPTLEKALRQLLTTRRSEFVFCSERGTPLDADNLRYREFPAALQPAELRRIRFHYLHHTYTRLLIAHGARPKYIPQLGHALIQTHSTATAISCPNSTKRRHKSSIRWCSPITGLRPRRARSTQCTSAGRRVGEKWEHPLLLRDGVGAKWEQKS